MEIKAFQGINSFTVGMAKELLANGVRRETRGFVCYELPYPLVIKITNPLARIVTLPERGWNHVLPFIESLWLSSGRNDIEMPSFYLPRLTEFSDNGKDMRAGYGPRFRFYNNDIADYSISFSENNSTNTIDQYAYVLKTLQTDINSRQAIISLADPVKDCFDGTGSLKPTKDRPCTRSLQFMVNHGKLDLYVHMRSNDYMWGATGVNLFNFTFLQEVFAHILGIKVGVYYHIANNFHYYKRHQSKMERLAAITVCEDGFHLYKRPFASLAEYDQQVKLLAEYEFDLRVSKKNKIPDFESEFMNDWAKVIYSHHYPESATEFENPILNKLVNLPLDIHS